MPQLRALRLALPLSLILAAHAGAQEQRPHAQSPEAALPGSADEGRTAGPIRIHATEATLDSVLTEIGRQSGFRVMYSDEVLGFSRRITLSLATTNVSSALEQALRGTGLVARLISARTVVVVKGDASTERRYGVISGFVADASSGRPVAGAAVRIGREHRAVTSADGSYSLTGVPIGRQVLQVTAIGYAGESRSVSVLETTTASVRLEPQVVRLDELLAIGYGTARRRDLTGAIEALKDWELPPDGAPSTSISGSLVGRVPGLQIVANSGAPGSSASLQIRGTHSIAASSEPLYVVDGIPLSPGASDGSEGTPLSSIDPQNIESVQILKDASATAIYGARGANGVVLITTARGTRGTNQITLETSFGIQKPTRVIDALNAKEFRTLVNEALTNVGQPAQFTQREIDGARTFDYPRQLLNNLSWQPQQSHALTVSGGDQQTRYLVSGNFLDQNGLIVNSGYQRAGGRVNLDRTVSSRFRIGASLSGTRSEQELNGSANTGNAANNTGITTAIQYDPAVFPFDSSTGLWNQRVVLNENFLNPYTEAVNRRGSDRVTALLTSVFGELDLSEGLMLRTQGSGNFNFFRGRSFSPSFIGSGNNIGTAEQSSGERRELTSSTTLNYRHQIGSGTLEALLGADAQASSYEVVAAESRGLPADELEFHDLGGGSQVVASSSNTVDWVLLSQLGRINYNLHDRYLFTVTARRDGSSRFGENDKWGIFPSAAFAWRAIDEPFLRAQQLLSDLKLRLSYGRTGNQAIEPYQSLEQLSTVFFGRGANANVPTLAPDVSAGNPELRWETQDQYNVGVDLALFENRLRLTLDAYQSNTSNLLLNTNQSWVTGVNAQLRNVGALRNRGVEAGLTTVNWEGEDFSWQTSLNVSANRNEVTELYGGLRSLGAFSPTQVGEPLNTFVGYQVLGLWSIADSVAGLCGYTPAECRPGEYRIRDADGNGLINDNDRVNLGNPQADFYGGFTSNMAYGPVSLDAFFNFSVGNDVNAQPFMRYLGLVAGASNERRDRALRRWTPQNQDTDVPRANILRPGNRTYSTYVEDASFLRLQTVTVGYQIPAWLVGAYADEARVTVTGQNLWITTRYSGWDPENQANDTGGYPRSRAWNMGVTLTF